MTAGWLTVAAKAWLWLVCSLAAWSLLPLAWGWQPVVVLTGSMEPAVRPGDIVVVDTDRSAPAVGQLVLVRDAGVPSGRLLHRVVQIAPDGGLVTRGDANRDDDSDRVASADVLGVGTMVVPAAGRFLLLLHRPDRADVTWALLTLCALVVVSVRRDTASDTVGGDQSSGDRHQRTPADPPAPGPGTESGLALRGSSAWPTSRTDG